MCVVLSCSLYEASESCGRLGDSRQHLVAAGPGADISSVNSYQAPVIAFANFCPEPSGAVEHFGAHHQQIQNLAGDLRRIEKSP